MRGPMSVFNRLGPWQDLSEMDFGDPDGGFRWFSGRAIPLTGSVFRGARLDGVHLDQTDISLADFTGASMVKTGMGFALAAFTSFRDADLTNADLWQLKAYRCDFRGARLNWATLRGVSAVECRFEGADFTGVELGRADATRATEEAAAFCRRFGIAIDRTGRYTNNQAATGWNWTGPCDFTGSIGLPDWIPETDRTLR
jgi:uncharacterized protein YjbI with pentapeptide repeats